MMMCWVRLILVNFVGLIDLEVPKKGGTYIYFYNIYIYIFCTGIYVLFHTSTLERLLFET